MPTLRPSTPICEPPLARVLARHAARELVRSVAGNGNQADGSAPAR